jgi:hypothetical protein
VIAVLKKERAMPRSTILIACVLAFAAAGQATVQAASQAASKTTKTSQCFRTTDIDNSVQANQTQLNLKLRDHRFIQVQTKGSCFDPLGINPYVLSTFGGTDIICQPADMDLAGGPSGFKTPCIVDKVVLLTPDQVAALPKKQKP